MPGAQIDANHELVKTIDTAHTKIMGSAPKRNTVLWCSDASVMTRFGIETVNYGPSSGPRDAEGEKVAVETFVNITKIYALADRRNLRRQHLAAYVGAGLAPPGELK